MTILIPAPIREYLPEAEVERLLEAAKGAVPLAAASSSAPRPSMPATVNFPNRVGNDARATTRAFSFCLSFFMAESHYSRTRKASERWPDTITWFTIRT